MIHAAATSFDLTTTPGQVSHNLTGARVSAVHGPIKTTVILLRGDDGEACLVAPDLSALAPALHRAVQATVSRATGIEPERVLQFSSHNHTAPPLSQERNWTDWGDLAGEAGPVLNEAGKQFLQALQDASATLPDRLEPVSIHWAVGHERRISYRRKGCRADGTTYFIREEDRLLLGDDFCGDIDDQAGVVRLVGDKGNTVAWLAHFSAHPVTAYHPEHPCVHPEYCGVAGGVLAGEEGAPVAFLQGCCGDVNSKGLLSGDVARAERHGRWLGETFLEAARELKPSGTDRMGLERVHAGVPFAPLPSVSALREERAEIEDFLRRARAGDEDTLSCIGLNFPRALSPAYRAALVEFPLQWNAWALAHRSNGTAGSLPDSLDMEVCVLRLGDVGLAGMPCEPFTAIGRRIRAGAPLPLVLPCGYCNTSYGYVTDSGNVDGREYMSAFYRYTKHPAFRAPAGDVLADAALAALRRLSARCA